MVRCSPLQQIFPTWFRLCRPRIFLTACLTLWLLTSAAAAHELGIERIELLEKPDGQYVLTAEVLPTASGEYPQPILPDRFTLDNQTVGEGRTVGDLVRYEFSCPVKSLRAGDTIVLPWTHEGVIMIVQWQDGTRASRFFPRETGGVSIDLSLLQAGSGSLIDMMWRYTHLGIEHILFGIDHLLFVFGLLLIVRTGWKLVKTITAFTLAHSITLALATLGLVHFPSQAVEATIALSIVFLGVEILHARQGRVGLTMRSPWIVAFGFGLLHGFGFAGALAELGLPEGEIPVALLFFNVGVELGQLMFVVAFLAFERLYRRIAWRSPTWVEPVPAYVIGTIAMYWFIDRVGFLWV